MIDLSLEEFMRAFAFARAVKKERPKEDFYAQLIGRLGAYIFWHEARRALPQTDIGDLNWFAMPKHVEDTGVDLRVNGWKIAVNTSSSVMQLRWPQCKRSDLFPKVSLDTASLAALTARYKKPKSSTPIGLLDDPIVRVSGEVVGWIGIGTAERLFGDDDLVSRVDGNLASPQSLWTLLGTVSGPNIRLADDAWQKAHDVAPSKRTAPRRIVRQAATTLLPPRRAPRVASAV